MTEGILRIIYQLAAITSWKLDNKVLRLIAGMQNGRIITVLNEHELIEHRDVSNTQENILRCHMKVKQIIINSIEEKDD